MGWKQDNRCAECVYWGNTVTEGRTTRVDERQIGDVVYRKCRRVASYEGGFGDVPTGAFLPDMGDANWAQSLWTSSDFGCSMWNARNS